VCAFESRRTEGGDSAGVAESAPAEGVWVWVWVCAELGSGEERHGLRVLCVAMREYLRGARTCRRTGKRGIYGGAK
jgi:hypothetical protein